MNQLFQALVKLICPDYSYQAKRFWNMRRLALRAKPYSLSSGIYKLIAKTITHKCGPTIPIRDSICPFDTPHELLGIVINKDATIGEGCTIFHQVTIGKSDADAKHLGAPTIGRNVLIGAGAKIIGNINVGDNAKIAANCIVVEDIPSYATVVMRKPKIIEYM